MRFPLALTTKIAAYIIGQKLRGTKKFATVLQLEPLHTCNLTCTGCGRIREYSTSLKDMMTLEDCLGAAEECNAKSKFQNPKYHNRAKQVDVLECARGRA